MGCLEDRTELLNQRRFSFACTAPETFLRHVNDDFANCRRVSR